MTTPTTTAHTTGKIRVGFLDGSGCGEDEEGLYLVSDSPDEDVIVHGGLDSWGIKVGVIILANAARLALCWNEHDGLVAERDAYKLSTDKLIECCNDAVNVGEKLLIQRDAYKIALTVFLKATENPPIGISSGWLRTLVDQARAALALCEKGGAE